MRRMLMIAVLGCLIGAVPLIGQETRTTTAPAAQTVTATLYQLRVRRYEESPFAVNSEVILHSYMFTVEELYVPSMGIAVIDGHVVPVNAKRYVQPNGKDAPDDVQAKMALIEMPRIDKPPFESVTALFDIQLNAADIEHLQQAEKEYHKSVETVRSSVNAERDKRAKQNN